MVCFDLTVSTHDWIPQQFTFHLISFGLLTSVACSLIHQCNPPHALELTLHARWPTQVVFNRLSRGLQKPGCDDSELYTYLALLFDLRGRVICLTLHQTQCFSCAPYVICAYVGSFRARINLLWGHAINTMSLAIYRQQVWVCSWELPSI